ncbi:unnamed protein product [Microthlaspi erraticum]|uniref:DUF223 domain-containing protein n=1 Tax=Microthlaspi erraticum TaxID=1685480 RepID=A0A6D2L5B0_9BRAS|nr:unnamed protein product [Microthlaspi erraticum]
MASAPVSFSDLKAGRNSPSVVARLPRFWEARNVKKCGELMGVEMLLIDGKSTLISATINVARLNTFKHLLSKGALYAIGGFDVAMPKITLTLCLDGHSILFVVSTYNHRSPQTISAITKEIYMPSDTQRLLRFAKANTEITGFKEREGNMMTYRSAGLTPQTCYVTSATLGFGDLDLQIKTITYGFKRTTIDGGINITESTALPGTHSREKSNENESEYYHIRYIHACEASWRLFNHLRQPNIPTVQSMPPHPYNVGSVGVQTTRFTRWIAANMTEPRQLRNATARMFFR